MPGGVIDIHALGKVGVMVDPEPLSGPVTNEYGTSTPALPDAALRQSQNMTHDPNNQHAGSLRCRPGLAQYTVIPMLGPVLGGVAVPVAGTGGAPASGGGVPAAISDVTATNGEASSGNGIALK